MKLIDLVICLAYLCCALVTAGVAQDGTGAAASSAVQDASSDEVKVESKYDKAKDETTIEFTQLEIAHTEAERVYLSVSATYAGQQKPRKWSEDIIFVVSVASAQGYKYPDMMAMQVGADGKELSKVLMLNLDKRRMDEYYLETIGTRMKYGVFKAMTQAKTVDLLLHDLKLQLNETQLAKLRQLEGLLHQ